MMARPEDEGVEVDPATPEARRSLARRIILAAIGRYEAASAMSWEVDTAYPDLKRAPTARGPEERAEQEAWRRVITQAQCDFDAAEMGLAESIQMFYRDLASPEQAARVEAAEWFVEKGLRVGPTLYVLGYHPGLYEPKTNIIAIVRDDAVIDLDPGKP